MVIDVKSGPRGRNLTELVSLQEQEEISQNFFSTCMH